MKDLTQGPVARHILMLAAPVVAGMFFQSLYYLVDLYFIAALGGTTIAGATATANITYLVLALTQVLSVGTVVLVAHAAGRNDHAEVNLIFNQSLVLATVLGLLVLLSGYGFAHPYIQALAADKAVVDAGTTYLYWFLPALATQFPAVAVGCALRGTGIVRPIVIAQALTVVLNVVLAPILIAGWGTNYPLGVAGAGLASSLCVVVNVILLWIYIQRFQRYLTIDPRQWRPRLSAWRRMFKIGLPAGGELAVLFVYAAVIYWAIRDFGAAAQAGFGIGTRIVQVLLLPVMAVASAVTSVAGQNFGAGRAERVRQTLRCAAFLATALMLAVTLFLNSRPAWLARAFTDDPDVAAAASEYLLILSWGFVAYGLISVCSGIFQSLGNTRPALLTSAMRSLTFSLAVVWLSLRPDFHIEGVWYCAVATAWLHALLSALLVRSEFRRRLSPRGSAFMPADRPQTQAM